MSSSHEATDDALVASTLRGDEEAFAVLFERYRRHVARIGGRFFSQVEQIEEIIQDSFTKAYFALNTYHGTHAASFKAWLSQIAINCCYDQLRRTQRQPPLTFIDVTDSEGHDPGVQLRAAGAAADIERAAISRDLAVKLLSRLSAEDRLVLTLLDVEGFSVAEISDITGWSGSKVKVRAHRARAHLRRILQKFI